MAAADVIVYAAKLQPEIVSCEYCQPWESEECQLIWTRGNPIEMRGFLESRGVPPDIYEDVAAQLHCQHCGEALDVDREISLKSPEEELYERRWGEWHSKYDRAFNDFAEWLAKYPYLGCQHAIGRQFLDQIRDFPAATFVTKRWWRARRVESPRELGTQDLGPPPKPPGSEGRFNHHGQRVFYLASDKQAAAAEVLKKGESLAWVQKFEVANLGKVMDLTLRQHPNDLGHESLPMLAVGMNWNAAHMQRPPDPEVEWKPEYFLPRYIADCARSVGFQGIMFNNPSHFSTNLVLFEWTDKQFQTIGKPEIISLPQEYREATHDDAF